LDSLNCKIFPLFFLTKIGIGANNIFLAYVVIQLFQAQMQATSFGQGSKDKHRRKTKRKAHS